MNDPRLRDALAALKPREHALWAWVLVPALAAVALAPGVVTVAGSVAVILAFLAHNGLGHALRRPERTLAGLTAGLLLAATLTGAAAAYASGAATVGLLVLVAAVGVLAAGAATYRGVYPKHAGLELGGIAACAGLAALLAVGGGASVTGAVAVAVALSTWFAIGWWWVKTQVAAVLPKRDVPRWAVAVPVAGLPAVSVACAALGHPAVGVVPWLYGARAALHAAPQGPRDVKRIGLAELAWAVVAAGAMVALV
jgi:hypothetical protein